MTANLQQSPYIREQRQYPYQDLKSLASQSDQAYVDIAQKINSRTIGTFALGAQIVTGEGWFLEGSSRKQQSLRQIYTFTSAGNIPHGIDFSTLSGFTRICGTLYDGTSYYPLPYVDVTAVNNQISIIVNSTNIVIASGAGSPPTIVSGIVILEWLSQY